MEINMTKPRLLIDTVPFKFKSELGEATANGNRKLYLRGLFALAGVPTENNRRYELPLWKRELERLEEKMQGRKLLGELDHPCLKSEQFQVLTESGWKKFRDIGVGEKAWSRKNGKAVLSTVNAIIDEPYDGPVYHFKGRSIDSTFTPGHRNLLVTRPGEKREFEEYVTSETIFTNRASYGHSAIPKTAQWNPESPKTFTLPAIQGLRGTKTDASKDLVIDANVFAAFMGIYLAEGCCRSENHSGYAVFVCQKNEWSTKYIYDEVLSKMSPEIQWSKYADGYMTYDARLYNYLKPLGDCYNKYIPSEIKNLGPGPLSELLFWFSIGDGRIVDSRTDDHTVNGEWRDSGKTFKEVKAESVRHGNVTNIRNDVFTVSEQLIKDLHECLIKTGRAGSISVIEPDGDYEFAGRIIKAENKVPLYQLHFSNSKHIWLDQRFMKIEEEHHAGRIYCLSVDHGNFYMEQNGHTFWTGNSDGQTRLQRVSHVITDLRIEGNEIIGEAEILPTPTGKILTGLIEAGIDPGISSRGYGSTTKLEDGTESVGDDYRLMTFDVVYDPATKTAYPDVFAESERIAGSSVEEVRKRIGKTISEEIERAIPEANKFLLETTQQTVTDKQYSKSDVEEAVSNAIRTETSRIKEIYARRLIEDVVAAKDELTDNLRESMLEDPSVAGAKRAIEGIVKLIRPFIFSEDSNEYIKDLENSVKREQQNGARIECELADAKNQLAESVEFGRRAVIKYHLAQKFSMYENKDTMVDLIAGSVTNTMQLPEIDELAERLAKEIGKIPVDTAAVENIELKHQIESLSAKAEEVEKLRGILQKAKTQLEGFQQLKAEFAEVSEVAASVQGLKDLLTESSSELKRLKEVEIQTAKLVDAKDQYIANIRSELAEARTTVDASKDCLRDSKIELNRLNAEVKRLTESEARALKLSGEVTETRQLLSESKDRINALTAEHERAKIESGKYGSRLKALKENSEKMKEQYERELQKYVSAVEILEERANRATEIVNKMKNGKKLTSLIGERAPSSKIDRILAESSNARHDPYAAEKARERVRRGYERSVEEDTFGRRSFTESTSTPLDELIAQSGGKGAYPVQFPDRLDD